MKASDTEIKIVNALIRCRFQPASFDKKFPKQINIENISPLQQWNIYRLGYKYRKQIGNDILATICKIFIEANSQPNSRRESEKIIKSKKNLTPTQP